MTSIAPLPPVPLVRANYNLQTGSMQMTMAIRAMLALFCAYCLAFLASGAAAPDAIISALINVAALGVAGLVVSASFRLTGDLSLERRRGFAIHVLGSLVFTFFWYFLIMAGFALGGSWIREGLVARAFGENAMVWQIFQGVTLYAMLALWFERRPPAQEQPETSNASATAADPSTSLLVRDGDQIVAVELDEIVQLSGADGYVEIVMPQRTFLSSHTLAKLTETLPGNFLRVHRSHIVRQGAIIRAEPAGNGRLTLHLKNGKTVITSRDGARLIRGLSA